MLPVPELLRIERRGLVVDGELQIELPDGGREFCSIDGDLFALFEGCRVQVIVEVVGDDDGEHHGSRGASSL